MEEAEVVMDSDTLFSCSGGQVDPLLWSLSSKEEATTQDSPRALSLGGEGGILCQFNFRVPRLSRSQQHGVSTVVQAVAGRSGETVLTHSRKRKI